MADKVHGLAKCLAFIANVVTIGMLSGCWIRYREVRTFGFIAAAIGAAIEVVTLILWVRSRMSHPEAYAAFISVAEVVVMVLSLVSILVLSSKNDNFTKIAMALQGVVLIIYVAKGQWFSFKTLFQRVRPKKMGQLKTGGGGGGGGGMYAQHSAMPMQPQVFSPQEQPYPPQEYPDPNIQQPPQGYYQ